MREALLLLPKTRMGERMAQKIKEWYATRKARLSYYTYHEVDCGSYGKDYKVSYIDNTKKNPRAL